MENQPSSQVNGLAHSSRWVRFRPVLLLFAWGLLNLAVWRFNAELPTIATVLLSFASLALVSWALILLACDIGAATNRQIAAKRKVAEQEIPASD